MKKILIFCGESAAGKDTIMAKVLRTPNDFVKIVSHTTRPKRDYETHEEDYYFVDNDYMLDNFTKFIEISHFNNWFYGTHRDALSDDKVNVGVFNPEGVRNIISEGFDTFVVYVKASEKTRLIRSLLREESPDIDEVIRRLHTDRSDFLDIEEIIDYTYHNGDKPDSFSDLLEAIDKWARN